jgi:NDP-sugar pyrophosphorylase family protein
MKQAIKAGFNEIIFVVGNLTQVPFMEKFGDSFEGTLVKYALQTFNPSERDKPWGTTDAIVSALPLIKGSFAICNGDDLYGESAYKTIFDTLTKNSSHDCVTIGYDLLSVLPEKGSINRGIFRTDSKGNVIQIEEMIGIEKNSLNKAGLNSKDLANMNIFGLTKECILFLEKRLIEFKLEHKGDRKAECYLPVELGNLAKKGKIKLKLFKTSEQWFGVTNPGDEEIVKQALKGKIL